MAVTSLVVIGVMLAGWASNNKWALLGGMRAAAQIVSYEVPVAMALIPAVLVAGSLSLQDIVRSQGDCSGSSGGTCSTTPSPSPPSSCISRPPRPRRTRPLRPPRGGVGAGLRVQRGVLGDPVRPLLPGGVRRHVHRGGARHRLLPGRVARAVLQRGPAPAAVGEPPLPGVFLAKAFLMVLVMMWVRWTLPRLRVDQLMRMSWKYLVP